MQNTQKDISQRVTLVTATSIRKYSRMRDLPSSDVDNVRDLFIEYYNTLTDIKCGVVRLFRVYLERSFVSFFFRIFCRLSIKKTLLGY